MIAQAKELKAALKRIGATRHGETKISVRTQINHHYTDGYRYSEYDSAISHIDPLNEKQIIELTELQPYAKIRNFPEMNFCIVYSN